MVVAHETPLRQGHHYSRNPVEGSAQEVVRRIMPEHLSPDTSPDLPVGLGRGAVHAALLAAQYALENKPGNQLALEDQRKYELDGERAYLASLDDDKVQMLEKLLKKESLPSWLADHIDFNDKKWGAIKQLTEKWPGGEYVVSDDVFQSFLEWHNHKLAEKQRKFDERLPQFKEQFTQKINMAVKNGWAPREVLRRLSKLDTTRTIIDDGLVTTLIGAGGTAKSAVDESHAIIKLAPEELSSPTRVLDHEFTHVLQGVHHLQAGEAKHIYRRGEGHGLYRIFGEWGGHILNEATVEHFSHSLRAGNFHITQPTDSRREGAVYKKNRSLLHMLSAGGLKPVDIKQFTWALFEDSYQNQNEVETARGKLVAALHEAFPFTDVVREIQEFTEETDVVAYTKQLALRVRLHRPHLAKRVGSRMGEVYSRGKRRVLQSRRKHRQGASHSV